VTATTMEDLFAWQSQGKCAGMNREWFFPEFDFVLNPKVLEACNACPVREICVQWAIDHDEAGVWGGLTEEQRKQITTTRSRVRCPDCRSDHVQELGGTEVCMSCGLSWLV